MSSRLWSSSIYKTCQYPGALRHITERLWGKLTRCWNLFDWNCSTWTWTIPIWVLAKIYLRKATNVKALVETLRICDRAWPAWNNKSKVADSSPHYSFLNLRGKFQWSTIRKWDIFHNLALSDCHCLQKGHVSSTGDPLTAHHSRGWK